MRATWQRQTVGVACAAICMVVLGSTSGAQTDPLVGTWKLDLAHSTYKPGPPPRGSIVTVEAAGKGVKVSVHTVGADGTEVKWGYSSLRDGKDTPVTNNPNYDTANVTQTSPTEGTIAYKKGGKTVVSVKTLVSKDGKKLTVTYSGVNSEGQPMNNVALFLKQ
jgi:hypothetical protein